MNIYNGKHIHTWKLNNPLLNDDLVKEEIKREIKGFLELNENEDAKFQILGDTMKAVVKGKLITLSASKKKPEKTYASSLEAHRRALEHKEANTHKRSRWQ